MRSNPFYNFWFLYYYPNSLLPCLDINYKDFRRSYTRTDPFLGITLGVKVHKPSVSDILITVFQRLVFLLKHYFDRNDFRCVRRIYPVRITRSSRIQRRESRDVKKRFSFFCENHIGTHVLHTLRTNSTKKPKGKVKRVRFYLQTNIRLPVV